MARSRKDRQSGKVSWFLSQHLRQNGVVIDLHRYVVARKKDEQERDDGNPGRVGATHCERA